MSHFYKTGSEATLHTRAMSNQLTAVHVFDAPPAAVFAAWVSPHSLVPPVTRIEVDARAGGALVIESGEGTDATTMTGYFVAVEKPKRIIYTWHWAGSAETTLIDVSFLAADERCVVDLVHRGFQNATSRELHQKGWSSYFRGLSRLL